MKKFGVITKEGWTEPFSKFTPFPLDFMDVTVVNIELPSSLRSQTLQARDNTYKYIPVTYNNRISDISQILPSFYFYTGKKKFTAI